MSSSSVKLFFTLFFSFFLISNAEGSIDNNCLVNFSINNDQNIEKHNKTVLNQYDEISIYQFAKVGSLSLWYTFCKITDTNDRKREHTDDILIAGNIVHTHSHETMQKLLQKNSKTLIINVVRNLFDKNMSEFFYQFESKDSKNTMQGSEKYNLDFFISSFRLKNPEIICRNINWYYKFEETLNVNLSMINFDFENKFALIETEEYDLLFIRYEDINQWGRILENALNLTEVNIEKRNISQKLWYAPLYKEFKENYRYSNEEIDAITNAPFMKIFYTNDEIIGFIQKYNR